MQPVDEATRRNVTKYLTALADLIKFDCEFVRQLQSEGNISHRKLVDIEGQQLASQKTKKLLEILLQRSLAVFDVFMNWLEKTNQILVMEIIRGTKGNTTTFLSSSVSCDANV